MPS
ncbi:hypothetical protein SAMN04487943_1052 [Gracilibacillus orientalis]|jgi:hypothetical protein